MDFLRLIAVVLLATAVGCAPARLFSRADPEEDFQLDPHVQGANPLRTSEPPNAVKGNWNVAQDDSPAPDQTPPVRSLASVPVSELLARADQARDRQNYPEARRHLDAILLQQPANPGAHHRLAVIADLEGRFGDAEHHYKMALHSDGHNPSIIGDLGYSYMLQGRLPLAEEYLLKARSLDPNHGNVALNLAQLYARRGAVESARQVLTEVLPPHDVEQQLAQLFPGASLQQTYPAAQQPQQQLLTDPNAPWPMSGDPTFAAGFPTTPPNQPSIAVPHPEMAPDHRTAMVVAPGDAAAGPYAGFAPSAQPYGASPFVGRGAPEQINFDSEPQALPPVEQAIATSTPATGSGGVTRRWPPPLWPPEPHSPAVQSTSGASSESTDRPKPGVNYLLPRRPQVHPTPMMFPAPPAGAATGSPGGDSAQAAPGGMLPSAPANSTASYPSPAQYSNGPGSSRIVTWSNLNGQSIDQPPMPPTDDELRAAAAMGLGGPQSSPVMRTSPGSASGWNGGVFPQPARHLPGGPIPTGSFPSQGAPIRATAPGSASATPQSPPANAMLPHPGFSIAPATVLPDNPLAGYEQDRRQFDEQFQRQVNETYGRSPSSYIVPPSASIPAPSYSMQPTGPQLEAGPPLTPNGTPWPGRTPESTVPGPQLSAPPAPQPGADPMSTVPAPYRSPRVSREVITPPMYRRQSATVAPNAAPPGLPAIVPGN